MSRRREPDDPLAVINAGLRDQEIDEDPASPWLPLESNPVSRFDLKMTDLGIIIFCLVYDYCDLLVLCLTYVVLPFSYVTSISR